MNNPDSSSPPIKPILWIFLLTGFWLSFSSSSLKQLLQINFVDISQTLSVSRGDLTWATSIFNLVQGFASPVIGWLCDKWGIRITILIGLFFAGVNFIALGTIDSLLPFIAIYGLVGSFSLATMSYVPMGLWVDKVFREQKQGLILAIVNNGAALGFVLLAPLWVFLQKITSWQKTFIVVGVLYLLMVLGYGKILPRQSRADRPAESDNTLNHVKSILTNKYFYALAGSFMTCGISMAFIDIHWVPMMQDHNQTAASISLALSVLGILEIAGSYGVGYWIDRSMIPKLTLIILYITRAFSFVWIVFFPEQAWANWFFSLQFGITYMGTVIITSLYCLKLFGARVKGLAFGMVFFVHQIGAFACSWLGGEIYDWSDSYTLLNIIIPITLFLACLPIIALPNDNRNSLG